MAEKIIARIGQAADVPVLVQGEIAWDIDTKTARFGDDTAVSPRIPTTKSTGSFDLSLASSFTFSQIVMKPGGLVDTVDLSTMNVTNGFVVRRADGVFHNVGFESPDNTLQIVNPSGVSGNVDIRLHPTLLTAINSAKEVFHDGTLTGTGESTSVLSVVQATNAQRGSIEIATQSEVNAGTDDTRAITPSTLEGITAPSNVATAIGNVVRDVIQLVSDATITGFGNSGSPLSVVQATTIQRGATRYATGTEVAAGVVTDAAVTPSGLGSALSAFRIKLAIGSLDEASI